MAQPTNNKNMCVAAIYAFVRVPQRLSRSILQTFSAAEPLRHEISRLCFDIHAMTVATTSA